MGRRRRSWTRSPSRSRSDTSTEEDTRWKRRRRSPSREKPRSRSGSVEIDRFSEDDWDGSNLQGKVVNEETETLWRRVRRDCKAFDHWTQLITIVEKDESINICRQVFFAFFQRYPYCYGYWCRLAKLEMKLGNIEEAIKVYEKGVRAFPISVDIWLAYIRFLHECDSDDQYHLHTVRKTQARALDAAGSVWNSDALWEIIFDFEMTQKNFQAAAVVYLQYMEIATAKHADKWDKFADLVNTLNPDCFIADTKQFEEYKLQAEKEFTQLFSKEKKEMLDDKVYREEWIKEALRKRIRDEKKIGWQKVYRVCLVRASYEMNIRRPYFHVQPLERSQLEVWLAYIDFMIAKKYDRNEIRLLFERSLVSCALYADFWIKFADWLTVAKEPISEVRSAYRRAFVSHCRKDVEVALAYSAFEEAQGNIVQARQILNTFNNRAPGYVMIEIRKLGIDRRAEAKSGKRVVPSVQKQYEELINSSGRDRVRNSFYAIRLARYLVKVKEDRKVAEKVILDAIKRDPSNEQLYLQLIDMAYTSPSFSETSVCSSFDFCLSSPNLTIAQKIRFSQRKLDFLEDLGSDIALIQEHARFHTSLLKHIGDDENTRRITSVPSRV